MRRRMPPHGSFSVTYISEASAFSGQKNVAGMLLGCCSASSICSRRVAPQDDVSSILRAFGSTMRPLGAVRSHFAENARRDQGYRDTHPPGPQSASWFSQIREREPRRAPTPQSGDLKPHRGFRPTARRARAGALSEAKGLRGAMFFPLRRHRKRETQFGFRKLFLQILRGAMLFSPRQFGRGRSRVITVVQALVV